MADRAPVAAGASSPDADLSEAFSDKTRPRRWGALLAFILFSVLTLVPAYWVTMTVSRDAQFIPSAMGLAEEATALQADLKLVTLVVRAPVSACENAVTRFNQRIPPERRAWLRLRCYAERPALAMGASRPSASLLFSPLSLPFARSCTTIFGDPDHRVAHRALCSPALR